MGGCLVGGQRRALVPRRSEEGAGVGWGRLCWVAGQGSAGPWPAGLGPAGPVQDFVKKFLADNATVDEIRKIANGEGEELEKNI